MSNTIQGNSNCWWLGFINSVHFYPIVLDFQHMIWPMKRHLCITQVPIKHTTMHSFMRSPRGRTICSVLSSAMWHRPFSTIVCWGLFRTNMWALLSSSGRVPSLRKWMISISSGSELLRSSWQFRGWLLLKLGVVVAIMGVFLQQSRAVHNSLTLAVLFPIVWVCLRVEVY